MDQDVYTRPGPSDSQASQDFQYFWNEDRRAYFNVQFPPRNQHPTVDDLISGPSKAITPNHLHEDTSAPTWESISNNTEGWMFPLLSVAHLDAISNHLGSVPCPLTPHSNHSRIGTGVDKVNCPECNIIAAHQTFKKKCHKLSSSGLGDISCRFDAHFGSRFSCDLEKIHQIQKSCHSLFQGKMLYAVKCDECQGMEEVEIMVDTYEKPLILDGKPIPISDVLFHSNPPKLTGSSCNLCEMGKTAIYKAEWIDPPKLIQVLTLPHLDEPLDSDKLLCTEFLVFGEERKRKFNMTFAYCFLDNQSTVVCKTPLGPYFSYDKSINCTVCTVGHLKKLVPKLMIYTLMNDTKKFISVAPDRKKRCVYLAILLKEPEIANIGNNDLLEVLQNGDHRRPESIEYYVGIHTGGHCVRNGHFQGSQQNKSAIYRTAKKDPPRRVFEAAIITKHCDSDMRRHEAFMIAYGKTARLHATFNTQHSSERMINRMIEKASHADKTVASMLFAQGEKMFCFDNSHPEKHHEVPGFPYHTGMHLSKLEEKSISTARLQRLHSVTWKKVKHSDNSWQCTECNKEFGQFRSIREHVRKAHRNFRFSCPQCKKEFSGLRYMRQHVRSVHEKIRFNCPKCNKEFSCLRGMQIHDRSIHQKITFKCRKCLKDLSSWKSLSYHLQNVHANDLQKEKNKCPTCLKVLSSKQSLKYHIESIHTATSQKKHKCPNCSGEFSKLQHMKDHIRSVHEKIRFICPKCLKELSCKKSLKYHMETVHADNLERNYKCPKCGKEYSGLQRMRSHVRSVHENLRFKCPKCGKEYSSLQRMQDHVRSVHDNLKYKCPKCGKEYSRLQRMRSHVRSVHENLRFKCPKCGKEFSRLQHMRDHVRSVHDKVRFNCSTCSKEFSLRRTLRHHMRTFHEGTVKFKCPRCNKELSSKHALNYHVESVHEGHSQKHKCPNCTQEFSRLQHMQEHDRTIHQKIRFECPKCLKKLSSKKTLKYHMETRQC